MIVSFTLSLQFIIVFAVLAALTYVHGEGEAFVANTVSKEGDSISQQILWPEGKLPEGIDTAEKKVTVVADVPIVKVVETAAKTATGVVDAVAAAVPAAETEPENEPEPESADD